MQTKPSFWATQWSATTTPTKRGVSIGFGFVLAATMAVAGCQDVTGLGDVGGPSGTSGDSIAPVSVVDSTLRGARLQAGDSISVTASDSTGLSALSLVLVRGTQVVFRSDTLKPAGAKTVTHKFVLKNLASNFPYGTDLKALGLAVDLAGNSAYSGVTGLDAANAVGPTIVVGKGSLLTLSSGSFNDLAVDYQGKYLYFTNTTQNSVGYIDLRTFTLGSSAMSPGSRPTNLSVVTQGLFGGSQLVVFAAGPRDFAVFNISNGPQSGSPLLRSDPALADVDSVSQAGVATSLVRLPTAATSSIFTACGLTSCTLFAGMTGGTTNASVLQKVDLTQASQTPGFDILSPDAKFPASDPTSILSGVDKAINLRAMAVDPATGQRSQIFYRSDRSLCGSVYGDSIVSGIRPDAQGPIYIRSNAPGCDLEIIRLDPTASSWELSTAAAVQVVREPRYSGINGILVSPAGSKVIIRTDDQILVADPDLRVRGELPDENPTGAGFLIGAPEITDGQWVAVAFGDKVVIYDTITFQPVASFPTATTMNGKLIFLPVGTGTDKVVILGLNSDRTSLVKIETSIAQIKSGTGL